MPLISFTGIHPTSWICFDDASAIDEGAYACVPVETLASDSDSVFTRAGKVAVSAASDASVDALAPYLDRVDAVFIGFNAFGDGRGFSLALRLKRDFAFKGEVRATGNIIPDQAQFLIRSGFDTVEVTEDRKAAFEVAADRYQHFYQCTINGDMSVAHKRHMTPA